MRARRTSAVLLSSLALALVSMTTSGPSAVAQVATACPVSASDQSVDSEEQALLGLINQYRQQNGKNALAMHSTVTRAAAWFSRDMASKNYFSYSHVDSNGRTIDQRLDWCGVSFSNWAENIFAGRSDAQSVFNAWRGSWTHNANLLRDGVTSAGIARAYASGSTYGWYWTLDLTNSSAVATTTTTAAPTVTTTTTRPATTTTTIAWWCVYWPQYCG